MPEVRRRGFGPLIGAAAQRTLLGVSQGAGMATTIARLGAGLPQPVATVRAPTAYSQTLTHGPGSDDDHEFTFGLGPGLWAAQVNAAVDTEATTGGFTVTVGGDAPDGTLGPFALSLEGDASVTFSVFVNSTGLGTLNVGCSIEAFDPAPISFSATVVAFRIS